MIRSAIVLVCLLLVGCSGPDDSSEPDDGEGSGSTTAAGPVEPGVTEPELRDELLAMQEQDQAERTGQVAGEWNDQERTDRLREIIDEHGWPTWDVVGQDGASAAWVIAQHSDLDVPFQEDALDLMRDAVAAGAADPTELAYLEDRVALNIGGEQVYGTQIGCVDGEAQPARLADPEGVEERRAEVGLEPLADYLASLADDCAAEAAASATSS
ncbi:DUF6624 domain-containing protein [Jiangella asiatica]|uniref:DUF6624 domain-containing protein n=1 Tax=Jiangella asiatica TaxID=2530372 RepID=UPI00193EAAA9|nr:DUF6624 domain-containing protein [Jiangella asiatica]